MDENEILEKIRHAQKLVEQVEDPYKIPSFQVILTHLLEKPSKRKIESEPTPLKEKPSIPTSRSLPELIQIVNPKSFPEKTLLVGYYLLKYEGTEIFNINDLDYAYSLARMRKPKNQNDVVNSLIEKGFFSDADQKKDGLKAFYLTHLGESDVEKQIQVENQEVGRTNNAH